MTTRAEWLVRLAAIAVITVTLLPLGYLVIRVFTGDSDPIELIFRARTAAILMRTIVLVVLVTGIATTLAVPLAWLTTRTDLPLRRLLSVATVLPLVVPSYVAGMVAIVALGPKGMLQSALAPLGVERLPEIYGLPGSTLVLVLLTYPYVLLTVRAALIRLDPSLEEASRSLGFGAIRSFKSIVLPLLRPAVGAGALLAGLYTLSDFGAVSLLRYESFTWAIFVQYESAFDRSLAASLSLMLAVVAGLILMVEIRTRPSIGVYHSGAISQRQPVTVRLGGWKWPAFALASVPALLGVVAPAGILMYWLARGILAGERLDFIWVATLNSLSVSGLAAFATVSAALPVAILAVRFRSRFSAVLEQATYFGFALPGIVVALALVFVGVNFGRPFYQTTALLVLAYVILFLPAASGAVRASLIQVSPRLEEAAQILGRTRLQTLVSVTLPLVLPGVMSGAVMVFLLTMKELPATLILGPIGFQSLATSIWSATSEAFFARAAAPALILILVAGFPTAWLVLRQRTESSQPKRHLDTLRMSERHRLIGSGSS